MLHMCNIKGRNPFRYHPRNKINLSLSFKALTISEKPQRTNMPKFVPVTDSERPMAEQDADAAEFEEHRKFDNPHSVSNKTDRGWEQGKVGWGVVKSFGGDDRDNGAQVAKHSEGGNKMVRNEKGLWVKAKSIEDLQETNVQVGGGRGKGGISVIEKYLGDQDHSRNGDSEKVRVDDDRFKDKSRDDDKRHAASDRGRRRSPEDEDRKRRKDKKRSESREYRRDRDSKRSKRSPSESSSDDSGRRGSRSRSRSRSRSPRHKSSRRDRSDSYDRRRRSTSRNKDRKRGRSRDRSSDRYRKRDDSRDKRKRNDSRSREKPRRDESRRRDRREDSEDRKVSKNKRSDSREDRRTSRDHEADKRSEKHHSKSKIEDESESQEDVVPMHITAVQVVNRFQEVFSNKKMSVSSRLSGLGELFQEKTEIRSLKDASKVYISGKQSILKSFEATVASEVTVSKRIYVEHKNVKEFPITFCLDLHRIKLAPGLGDPTKENALLYQCEGPGIYGVWGMVDSSHLANDSDLSEDVLFSSSIWTKACEVIANVWFGNKEADSLKTVRSSAHYHNYDHMEVWG